MKFRKSLPGFNYPERAPAAAPENLRVVFVFYQKQVLLMVTFIVRNVNNQFYLILWVFACGLFTACSNSPVVKDSAAATEDEELARLLAPNEAGIPYPIYNSFEEMAALLEQADDRTYVINFWATWCGPCVEEMAYFEKLGREADAEDLQIVMVSLDFQKDVRTKLRSFVEARKLALPVVALADGDYNAWIDRVDPDWEGAIPYTLVYRGSERRQHSVKFNSYEELQNFVEEVN